MSNLKKIAPATYMMPKKAAMRVAGLIIATEELLQDSQIEKPLEQVYNVAHLPGIRGYSIAMPDMHWGYGFPIGGVAAMDAQEGVISPGGVGYDINCGVRLAIVPLAYAELNEAVKRSLLDKIFQYIPSGVGRGHRSIRGLSERDYQQLLQQGARWSIEKGYGLPIDLEHTESYGCILGADPQAVSHLAKERGKDQLGSIGSGNHFVEIGQIEKIFLADIADAWEITQGMTYVLIHSGSRGFGHQVCQDALNLFIQQGYDKGLPDRQLVAAPIQSKEGQYYFSTMAAAANFAFNNRQQILHQVREAFKAVLNIAPEHIRLLYDVCHNIAKFETHSIDGTLCKVCVHRKGATRAFGPGAEELSSVFRKTGQPVLVPGDMLRASHLLVGQGNPLTWCSCCHGAGRQLSRIKSSESWRGRNPVEYMHSQGVIVKASSSKTVAEEMPEAYKDVDTVVKAVEEAGLAKMVARLRPHLVVKG